MPPLFLQNLENLEFSVNLGNFEMNNARKSPCK